MHPSTILLGVLGLLTPRLLNASPLQAITPQQCSLLGKVVSALQINPNPTSLCSSYLHISTATVTATATATSLNPLAVSITTGTATVTASPTTSTTTIVTSLTTCGGEPLRDEAVAATVLPSNMAPFPTARISSACSCLNIPTPTITVKTTYTIRASISTTTQVAATTTIIPIATSTVTSTSTIYSCLPVPTPSCDNAGKLEFAIYYNPYPKSNGGDNYSNFDPTIFKTANPIYGTGNTSTVNFYQYDGPTATVYGKTITRDNPLQALCYAVNIRGYFVPPVSGEYTITSNADDIVLFWVAGYAYSGWTRENAASQSVNLVSNHRQDTFNLRQGYKTPFRILFGNCPSDGILEVQITGPGGVTLIGSDGAVDGEGVITSGCAGDVTASPFAPFGSET